MQKTKLALVSLLSLLVVLAPVSSVLAETEKFQRKRDRAPVHKRQQNNQNEVFEEIEKYGGREVGNKELAKEKGEFGYWGTIGMAAAGGALGGASYYSFGYATGQHGWDWSEFAGSTIGAAAGAASGVATGVTGAASAFGTIVGGAMGDFIGGLF